jgi:hypothetical protein
MDAGPDWRHKQTAARLLLRAGTVEAHRLLTELDNDASTAVAVPH